MLTVSDFQQTIAAVYFQKDSSRGVGKTFMWFAEEVGELAQAIRRGDPAALKEEFSDVFAWLASLATLCNVNLEEAAARYLRGCPKCGKTPCFCENG